MGFREDLQTPF